MSATKTILTIGYREYLLPASANVNVLLKALAGCVELESRFHDGQQFYFPSKKSITIKIETVDARQVIEGKQIMIPEKCGPEAMGEMV